MKCALCEIEYEDKNKLNFHHLIPKSFHSNKRIQRNYSKNFLNKYGVYLCISCHNKLHSCIDEKDLAFEFNSIEKIKEVKDIQNWINWKKKHPNFNNTFNRMTNNRRK